MGSKDIARERILNLIDLVYNSYKEFEDEVSRALDHKSVEVTKRYLAIDDRENAEAVRTFSPMDLKFRQTSVKVVR